MRPAVILGICLIFITQIFARIHNGHHGRGRAKGRAAAAGNSWREAALKVHNELRAKHGNPPLVLDNVLNASAQKCAEHLAKLQTMAHICKDVFGHKYGENLGYRTASNNDPTFHSVKTTNKWYNNEIGKYDYNNKSERKQSGTGHFSQLVWKNTKKLGMGFASNGNFHIVVAHYDPHGNVGGGYAVNVPKPKK